MRGEELPTLHGLPLAVKDMLDAKGLPTTFGSPLFAQNIADKDEAIVAMLRKAGAIVIGKYQYAGMGRRRWRSREALRSSP